jgi:hypothetical protein
MSLSYCEYVPSSAITTIPLSMPSCLKDLLQVMVVGVNVLEEGDIASELGRPSRICWRKIPHSEKPVK